jgi:hypothetical protein
MQPPYSPVTSNTSSTKSSKTVDILILTDHDLSNRSVYTERPIQSWMAAERQSYSNKLYNNNSCESCSFLLIPSLPSSNPFNNDIFAPSTSCTYGTTVPNSMSASIRDYHQSNSAHILYNSYTVVCSSHNGEIMPSSILLVGYTSPTPPPSQIPHIHFPSPSQFSNSVSSDQSSPSISQDLDDQLHYDDQCQDTVGNSRSKVNKKREKVLERNRQVN